MPSRTNAATTNDAFTFIGTNVPLTGSAGQLHAFWNAIGQIVEGDVNGDAKPDFSIEIKDPAHAITLGSTDLNPEPRDGGFRGRMRTGNLRWRALIP